MALQTEQINYASDHVDATHLGVNGEAASLSPDDIENQHISDIVDDLLNSAEASISGGSDTDASRPDIFKGKDGEKGHVRTSSAVKKPATFKSVSVNKTFLAAKASPGAAPVKAGDKPNPSAGVPSAQSAAASSVARPRLVAKTGSGLGHSLQRSLSGANGGKPAVAPDPNAVWNKNRRKPFLEPPLRQPCRVEDEQTD